MTLTCPHPNCGHEFEAPETYSSQELCPMCYSPVEVPVEEKEIDD